MPRRDCDCDFCFAAELNAVLRRFLEQREKGRVPVDPDAEQLAADVAGVRDEMARVG
jgi:hypothetical protein